MTTDEIIEQLDDDCDSNLLNHARRELEVIGMSATSNEDDIDAWMYRDIMELLTTFSKQNHSGMSAPYCLSIFDKLARFQPLAPLTGEDNEWVEVSDSIWQNNRCSSVFKTSNDNASAYDINGKVFVESDGSAYTSVDSRVPVTFPYTPTTEYVNV